ncbi:uncharacterized protein K452DRAFT_307459 [Aplosporella prunicola CBS 121167]|uniref:MARVEL domain-containing protein n=1 Tax=Aplosporella prunicola CBS 121167 TaxID=1176127 RepID=A0A6A6BI74_9PEZI|nr:uncharacterized protein K452DRAFT_307459 [Aplosporella prunicola CBS 121167]KAF2143308.1 hypothetical protein K452DRAFT_307459 [Aplosporella prunicola CBS 121167]
MQPAHFRIAQLSIAGLCLAFGVAIMGTAGHTLDVYRSQYSTNPWWLPLWSSHFNVRGTNVLIGAGAVATVVNLTFIALCLLPKLNLTERTTLRAFITITLIFPSALISFITVIYVHVINHSAPDTETIQTWTCKVKGQKPGPGSGRLASAISNGDFGRLCTESKFALYTTLVIFLLQTAMLVGAIVTWCVEKYSAHKQRKFEDVSSVEMKEPHVQVQPVNY